jgi:hypothetical protein
VKTLFRIPGKAVSAMPSTTANLLALAVIAASIVAATFEVKLGADLYMALYLLIFLTAKITNGLASAQYLGRTVAAVLSPAQRSATRRFALYIWHPAGAYMVATILHWPRFVSIIWIVVTLWQGLYFETAVLVALAVFVSGTIAAMYPDLYFVDAAERGNTAAVIMLRELREVQQILSRNHLFAPHLILKGALEPVFDELDRLMADEQMQIDRLPERLRSEILRGMDCDVIANSVGKFGRDVGNPIPVNGPIGEVIYLSNLRSAGGSQLCFIGSVRLGRLTSMKRLPLTAGLGTSFSSIRITLVNPGWRLPATK